VGEQAPDRCVVFRTDGVAVVQVLLEPPRELPEVVDRRDRLCEFLQRVPRRRFGVGRHEPAYPFPNVREVPVERYRLVARPVV